MAISLSTLTVELQAENSKLHGQLDRSQRRLRRFEGAAKRTSASLGRLFGPLVAGLSAAAFVGATRGALDFADAIDKAAKVSGLTTDELQELRFAGDQLGVSTKLIDEGFRRFSRRLGEFANSGGGPAAKALEALNIEIKDAGGGVRSTGSVFDELVAKMQGIESQAQRSAIAAQVFGDDAGPKLEQLLAQGVAGLGSLRAEAQDIGAVMSSEVIANAVEAGDSLGKLGRVIKVQLSTALVELAPFLTSAAEGLIAIAREARAAFGDINNLSKAATEVRITQLLSNLEQLQTHLTEAERIEGSDALKDRLLDFVTLEPAALQRRIAETEEQLSAAYARISEIDFAAGSAKSAPILDFDFDGTGNTAAKAAKKVTDEWDVAFRLIDAQFAALDDEWARGFTGLSTGKQQVDEVSDAARDLGLTFSSAFEDAAIEGDNLRDVVQGLGKDILRIALRKTVTEPLGDFFSAAFSGFFAGGTNFAPGGLAVVGEQGPELVNLPRGSQVIPNNQIGGGGLVVNVDARGSTDPLETERNVRRAVREAVGTMRSMKARGALPEF